MIDRRWRDKHMHNSLVSVHKKLCIPEILKSSFILGKTELKNKFVANDIENLV